MSFPSSDTTIYSPTELPFPRRYSQALFAKPFPPRVIGLVPLGIISPIPRRKPMPKDRSEAPTRGGGDPGELGRRQDGFLPLLHAADVSVTLPVWGERPGGC